MALPQPNAYKGSSYGGKIATPRLDSRGANLQQQGIAEMNDKRLREQFDTRMDSVRRKEILQMQKDSATAASTMYDKVGKVTGGGTTYQQEASNYWNNQINEAVKIKQGMNKLPNEEGYIDPVIGARMITNIDSSIDKYSTGVNSAAAEAVIIDDALKNPIGEEGSLSITNTNLPQAKLLQDWSNGVPGIGLESNDQGQTLLTRDGVVFNIDAYVDAQDDEVDMFLKVPSYKDQLSSTAVGLLGGGDGENYSTEYYDYKSEKDGTMVKGSLVPNEEAFKNLAGKLSNNDKTIMRMANDPIYAKVYWKDVLGQKTTWSGDDNQKQQLRLKLAEKSIEIARERNGTQSAKFTDVKIYAPKNNNSKIDKNNPNTSTVTIGGKNFKGWAKSNLTFGDSSAMPGSMRELKQQKLIAKNEDKVKKKLLEEYPNNIITGETFLKNNPGGVGNLDAQNVNPEDLLIKFTNKDSGVVKYQIVDLSDNKLRSIDSVSALLRDPGATSNISQKSDVI